jgi:uncharacterized protein (TIGR03437 family)
VSLSAQTPPLPAFEWRKAGNNVVALGLASPAGGPVARVWFSRDGQTIFARTGSGRTFSTSDLEKWVLVEGAEPVQKSASNGSFAYRFAQGHVWRSEDSGGTWTNVTEFERQSIIGGQISDIAVSETNPQEIVVAGGNGVWRSVDGGTTWAGLNEGLPNLPATRFVSVPADDHVIRLLGPGGAEIEWRAGERAGWRPANGTLAAREAALRQSASVSLGVEVTALASSGDIVYAGSADGRLFSSGRPHPIIPGVGRIERIFTDARDPLYAVAISTSRGRGRVLRTLNGGVLWDDITSDLPAQAEVRGVTADRVTGVIYAATSAGAYAMFPSAPRWRALREGSALDVMLDASGNQLYVLFEGSGVYATLAPHRILDPRVVSAGDRVLRAAAPGALISVVGAKIESARAGGAAAAVLAAGDLESQIQLPFELPGTAVQVSLDSATGRVQLGLPVNPTSPSIFVDRDGNPLVMNADTGLMLDAATPARSNTRVQILATGLGRVTPDWPTGLAAPLQEPPRVLAPIRAWLEREQLEITRATLAPGYVGMYVVEVRIPPLVNRGTAELYIDAGDQSSNRVRIYVEP